MTTISLTKGQRINVENAKGVRLTDFCVGCNWGNVERSSFFGLVKSVADINLKMSCIMVDANGKMCDYVYSPRIRAEFLARYGKQPGKADSNDGAMHYCTTLSTQNLNAASKLDNEVVTVNLNKVGADVQQIFFFLNNRGQEDFSRIPYACIRMFEGAPESPQEVVAKYDVASRPQYKGATALIMGKLYRYEGAWKFAAIGDAYKDQNLCYTIDRILENYAV